MPELRCQFFLVCVLVMVKDGFSADFTRMDRGLPWGQLSKCPGTEKPVTITKKSLRYLTISVVEPGLPYVAKKTTYNYFEMRKLAKDPHLDFRKRTIIYVGGYLDTPLFIFARLLAKLYNEKNYNVLLLDTNRFTLFRYPLASRYIRAAGKHTAEVLAYLYSEGLDPSKLELIGLSLGGQTISFIAKHFRELTGRNVSRLTGLDPSGPCFRDLGPDQRLDNSDADFVDVIATNIDGFGMASPVGHVNFYVNGGEYQPGDVIPVPCNILCSHLRVYTLWVAALQYPNNFIALKCDSVQQARDHECYDRKPLETNLLGLNVDKCNEGIFYLATGSNFPYFLGEKGLRKENSFWTSYLKVSNADDGDIVAL